MPLDKRTPFAKSLASSIYYPGPTHSAISKRVASKPASGLGCPVSYKREIWDRFCVEHSIADQAVPLFQSTGGVVKTFMHGEGEGRCLVRRSEEMEALIVREVTRVLEDYDSGSDLFEGLIYMMFHRVGHEVIPLYIGKSEKFGKSHGVLSANIAGIEGNRSKFCRWGNSYAYHIGDLSAVVCPGHSKKRRTRKYSNWANKLFAHYPSASPQLREPVYFWITAWKKGGVGIWEEFGPTSLTFLEYLLIGVASDLFPGELLNDEGVNRE